MPDPEYEALLREKFDAVEVWQVYADWLDERGEALEAQRIRCGRADGDAFNGLVARGWPGWFPGIAQRHLRATWETGFIRHAALDFRANVQQLGALFAAPVMRFLKTFGMRCEAVSLDGAWLAPALTHLDAPIAATNLIAPLAGHAMPALEDLCLALHVLPDSWMSGLFSTCARCTGDDTRLVHYSSCRADLNSFETTTFEDWEYECMERRLVRS